MLRESLSVFAMARDPVSAILSLASLVVAALYANFGA
jgi:hypothetical protein